MADSNVGAQADVVVDERHPTREMIPHSERVALMYDVADLLQDPDVHLHVYEQKKETNKEYVDWNLNFLHMTPETYGASEARAMISDFTKSYASGELIYPNDRLQAMKEEYQAIVDARKATIGYQVSEGANFVKEELKSMWCTVAAAAVDKGGLSEEFAMRTPEYKSTSVHVGRWLLPATEKIEPLCPEAADKAEKVASAVTPIKP